MEEKETPEDRVIKVLGPSVLKESEQKILEVLHQGFGKAELSKTELREKADLSPPVFSEDIKNLKNKGYIEIEPDSEDARIKKVRPTGKGYTEQTFFGIPARWAEKLVTKHQISQQMKSKELTDEQKEELKEEAKTYGDLSSEEIEEIENYEFEDLVEELGAMLLHALARASKEFHKETKNLDENKEEDYERILFEADRVQLLKENLLNGILSAGGVLTSENIYGGRYDEVLEKLEEKYPFKWERGAP